MHKPTKSIKKTKYRLLRDDFGLFTMNSVRAEIKSSATDILIKALE